MAIQIRPEQEQRLNHLASRSGLTPDELLQQQLDRFLDYHEDLAMAVRRGDEDIAAGRVLDHEEVAGRIEMLLHGR
jgi:predicted transcriptional regulator